MAVRQRHVYETAFDSLVRSETEDFDVLLQSPLLRTPPEKLRLSPRERRRPVQTSGTTEKRKVTTVARDFHLGTSPRPRKVHVREKSTTHIANSVFAALSSCWDDPREASVRKKSSPKLGQAFGSHNKLNGSPSSISSAERNGPRVTDGPPGSTRDHPINKLPFHSKTTVNRNQSGQSVGDESLVPYGDIQRPVCFTTNFQHHTEDPKTPPNDSKAFSPSVEFKKLDVDDKSNNDVQEEYIVARSTKDLFQHHGPSCYTPVPKGFLREPMKDRANLSKDTSRQDLTNNPFFKGLCRSAVPETVQSDSLSLNAEHGCKAKYAQNSESAPTSHNNSPENKSFGNNDKKKLSLDFSRSPKRARQHLTLDFGWKNHNIFGENVDATVQLQQQGWYHGSISRQEAENVLRLLKEGSYLVRSCENSKSNYSLSLKSSHGVIHVKIGCSEGKFFLKQLEEDFESIPAMVQYYSQHRLPVHGVEHMVLMHPVIDQLL